MGGYSKYGSQHQTRHVECRCHDNEDPSRRSIQLTQRRGGFCSLGGFGMNFYTFFLLFFYEKRIFCDAGGYIKLDVY